MAEKNSSKSHLTGREEREETWRLTKERSKYASSWKSKGESGDQTVTGFRRCNFPGQPATRDTAGRFQKDRK